MKKVVTLSFLLDDTRVCLGMKKRGFGAGKWNGFGGKVEGGETIEEGAVRELSEETGGVIVRIEDLEKIGVVSFYFKNETQDTHEVHVFVARQWEGEPVETEEMKPAWYAHTEVPYESMWVDDQHWLPHVLAGGKISGDVWFDETGNVIENMEWRRS